MGCTVAGHKTFLLVSNLGLLFTGLSVIVLGVKMKIAMAILTLDKISVLSRVVQAVIATGFFIAFTSGSGIGGTCCEVIWLLSVHMIGLVIIAVMEFSIGVTLIVVKNTAMNIIDSEDCGLICETALRSIILDLAVPTAGVMMSIILFEGFMIYSAVQLFFYLRNKPKFVPTVGASNIVVQNVQMQNVTPLPILQQQQQPGYLPQQHYTPVQLAEPSCPQHGYTPMKQMDEPMTNPPPYENVTPKCSTDLPEESNHDFAATSSPRPTSNMNPTAYNSESHMI